MFGPLLVCAAFLVVGAVGIVILALAALPAWLLDRRHRRRTAAAATKRSS